MSFTPGPWEVDGTKATGVYGVWTGYATHPGHDGAGYASQICSFDVIKMPREQRDSNAKLISCAPELLALLKKCEQMLTFRLDMAEILDEEKAAWSEARSLIAKAEGRS